MASTATTVTTTKDVVGDPSVAMMEEDEEKKQQTYDNEFADERGEVEQETMTTTTTGLGLGTTNDYLEGQHSFTFLEQAKQEVAKRIKEAKRAKEDAKRNLLLPYLSPTFKAGRAASAAAKEGNATADTTATTKTTNTNVVIGSDPSLELAQRVKDALMTDGYIVLQDILNTDECQTCVDCMTDFMDVITKASGGVPPKANPLTKIIDYGDAGFLLRPLHTWISERIYEHIYQTNELHCSKEGFTFCSNGTDDKDAASSGIRDETKEQPQTTTPTTMKYQPVVAQAIDNVGLFHIRSATCLSSSSLNQPPFVIYPKSFELHSEFNSNHKPLTLNRKERKQGKRMVNHEANQTTPSNCYPKLCQEDIEMLQEKGYEPQVIHCQPGDVLLWRSDLVVGYEKEETKEGDNEDLDHVTCGSTTSYGGWGYVSVVPTALASKHVIQQSLEGYKLGRTTTHELVGVKSFMSNWIQQLGEPWIPPPNIWGKTPKKNGNTRSIHKVHMKDDDGDDCSKAKNQDESGTCHETFVLPSEDCNLLYNHYGPPEITWRQAELYGIVPYLNQESDTYMSSLLKILRLAFVRGIRFSDKDTILTNDIRQELGLPLKKDEDTNVDDNSNTSTHHQQLTLDNWSRQHLCGTIIGTEQEVSREGPSGATVSILDPKSIPLMGQDKWLGGMSSPDGEYIYGVPGTAKQVLQIEVKTGLVKQIGPKYEGGFKWLRGLDMSQDVLKKYFPEDAHKYPKGTCLALPSNALYGVLEINPATQEVSVFGGPFDGPIKTWMWHGGCVAPANGLVYAIPANHERVLRIHPTKCTVDFVGPDLGQMKQKWYGGLCSEGGSIYGIPQNAAGILKITPHASGKAEDDLVEVIHPELFDEGFWKWHGGTMDSTGTIIYGYPNNADSVLKIDTRDDSVTFLKGSPRPDGTPLLQSGNHRIPQDDKYKYLGGAVSLWDNCLYLFPSEADQVLQINLETDELRFIGPKLLEGGNKYQNGFFSSQDGAVYAIPQHSKGVLRIQTYHNELSEKEPRVEILSCGPTMLNCRDKFEGGVLGPLDGCIYCIPLRAKRVVKIIPALSDSSSS